MNHRSLLSIITPVYNAARYLPDTYRCLCEQDYEHWEWVVVNDGSTDERGRLLKAWAAQDSRILYVEQPNSGAAKQPRDRAVYMAHGDYVVFLDADDYLAPGYLSSIWARREETDTDIVYATMYEVRDSLTADHPLCHKENEQGEVQILPHPSVDTTKVYVGRDLVRYTMPEWRIGCNGGLYHRSVWVNMSYPKKSAPIWMNSDEVDERMYLQKARRVAFCKAIYYYRRHDDSITLKFSPKLFHPLKTSEVLLDWVEREFGRESEEFHLAHEQAFSTWRSLLKLYVQQFDKLPDAAPQLYSDFAAHLQWMDVGLLPRGTRLQFFYLRSFFVVFALFSLKYNVRCLYERLYFRFFPQRYAMKVVRKRTQAKMVQDILQYRAAHPGLPSAAASPCVVSVFCGETQGGGLVDRLRGIVSTYQVCQALNIPYKIYFVHPFALSDYLAPNAYDWSVGKDELTFNPEHAELVVSDTLTDSSKEREQQRRFLMQRLAANPSLQKHVYTNAAFSYDNGFAASFRQLFRPTERMQKRLDEVREQIGGRYVSVSLRLRNLLDDFNEENYSEPLPAEEQQELLAACVQKAEELHRQHPDCRMVVCSDSTTFLQAMAEKEYAFVIPGIVSHIDNDAVNDYAYYEKTFLDFFTIAAADRVYLLKERRSYLSGFPYAAALVGGKNYSIAYLNHLSF